MKWGKRDTASGNTGYWFEWEGKISLQDCWNAVLFLSKIGKLIQIYTVELHDVSDASAAGAGFDSAEKFSDWAGKQKDAPEYDGGYELDHAEVFMEVDGKKLKVEVLPRPLWVSRGKSRDKLEMFFVFEDKAVGDEVAKVIKGFKIGEGA